MFEKEAEEYLKKDGTKAEQILNMLNEISPLKITLKQLPFILAMIQQAFQDGAELAYNKANESHSPNEHIDKNRVVIGVIKHCNKIRYSLVQWNGEWWYQYGTYNAEVRLITWYNTPELPKESE